MEKKCVIEQKELLSLLASMQPICTKRTTLDTTTAILFHFGHRELILKSTDLEISLQANCPVQSSTMSEGEAFLVPGKRIFDLVKELEGSITCTYVNNQLLLEAGPVHVALHIKDAQEFPPFPERIENLMHIDATTLRTMLEAVAFLIPQNNPHQALNGLLLEITPTETKMTTTDGHCLAQITNTTYTLQESRTWLLPRRAIFELKKILDTSADTTIFIGLCGNQLVFSGEQFNFFTKLLHEQFPQYTAILDKKEYKQSAVSRAKLMKTVRRSVCLLSHQFLATRFVFHDQKVRVTMSNKEVGNLDEYITLEDITPLSMTIHFYAPYLLNGLQAFKDEHIIFFLNNNAKPIIFESRAEHYAMTYLVMPVSAAQAPEYNTASPVHKGAQEHQGGMYV